MILKQYYLGCLSHASYLVGDETTGRAVVIDPQRDVSQYLEDARAHGLTIERVFETHFHADFLSGHLELADRCGATITYGAKAEGLSQFPIDAAPDGAVYSLGDVRLEVMETPGHTPESISILVYEHADDTVPYGVFTGDTLFIGDVGRPDLLASVGVTAEELARMLYVSIQQKMASLPDETRVYPAHGAGSACGKNLSTETVSTIGEQKRSNYAMLPMSEETFVAAVTEGQPTAPPYFIYDATMNKQDRARLDEDTLPPALRVDQVLALLNKGAVVLDTRSPEDFALAHLKGSVNVGLGGRFAEYSGDVVRHDQDIVLVADPGTELEAKVRLARIGFDRVVGHLANLQQAFLAHPEAVTPCSRVTAIELEAARMRLHDRLQVVDIRNLGEITASGHLPGAVTIPLPQLTRRLDELDTSKPTVVYCAGGYRSSIAASTLASNGFTDVSDLIGGFDAWAAAGMPVVKLDLETAH